MEQVEGNSVPGSIRQEIDDALMLLQYAAANGVVVMPAVIEEILRAAAEVYPKAFDVDVTDLDYVKGSDEAGSIASFLERLNSERQALAAQSEGGDNVQH